MGGLTAQIFLICGIAGGTVVILAGIFTLRYLIGKAKRLQQEIMREMEEL